MPPAWLASQSLPRCIASLVAPVASLGTAATLAVAARALPDLRRPAIATDLPSTSTSPPYPSLALLAALFGTVCPAALSRSSSGAFDQEALGLPLLLVSLVATACSAAAALSTSPAAGLSLVLLASTSFGLLCGTWGGYVYPANIIAIFWLAMLLLHPPLLHLRRVATLSLTFTLLLPLQVPYIGTLSLRGAELAAVPFALAAWLAAAAVAAAPPSLVAAVRSSVSRHRLAAAATAVLLLAILGRSSLLSPVTGRLWALVDPTYASSSLPLIASVAEHQPTTWASFALDLHVLILFVPLGLARLIPHFRHPVVAMLLGMYLTSLYAAGAMVRLLPVHAAPAALVAAVGAHALLLDMLSLLPPPGPAFLTRLAADLSASTRAIVAPDARQRRRRATAGAPPFAGATPFALTMLAVLFALLVSLVRHSTWAASEAYSSPMIILSSRVEEADGTVGRAVIDDFREVYAWLDANTDPTSVVASWWDYGYQLSALSHRPTLVDNNTWNNTHIGLVGAALTSPEEQGVRALRALGARYLLILFGGATGYPGDDLSKVQWMARIGGLNETTLLGDGGRVEVGEEVPDALRASLIYRCSYARFGEVYTEPGKGAGFDRARQEVVADRRVQLSWLVEEYTSERWLFRLYRLLDEPRTVPR